MKFKILKVNGNSMHPTIESGAFVFVFYTNKFSSPFNVLAKLPFIRPLLKAGLQLNEGDIVAVEHDKYGLIIKRIVKVCHKLDSLNSIEKSRSLKLNLSKHKINNKKNYQSTLKLRLKGDNEFESITENDIGWVDVNSRVGKVIYVVHK